MSDNYRIICTAKEVENPEELAEKIINWMQKEKIIEDEATDCVLNSYILGFKPSSDYLKAILEDDGFTKLNVCGVEVQTEREVFNAMGFTTLTSMICPNCNRNRFEGISSEDFYGDNLTNDQLDSYHLVYSEFDKWTFNRKAELTCPFCEETSALDDYTIGEGLSLSNLGLTFWNWPEFKTEFVEKIKELVGVEIKLIVGHI